MNDPIIPDISHWTGDADFEQMKAAGAKGVILRAGSCNAYTGVPYTDYKWERNIDLAPQQLPVIAVYWYYRPQHDPNRQADYLLELIEQCDFPVIPAPDFETTGGLVGWVLSNSMRDFTLRIQEARVDKRILDYTRGEWWNSYAGYPDWIDENHLLWIARYSNAIAGPWSDGYYQPRSWDEWLFWQWSADGNWRGQEFGGGDRVWHIDLNRFAGTEQELYALVQYTPVNPPSPPVDPSPDQPTILLPGLYKVLR